MPDAARNLSRYRAYANYTIAFSRLAQQLYPSDEALVRQITGSAGFQKLPAPPRLDKNGLAKVLRHSWFTELAMIEAGKRPTSLFYTNPWCMVQSYYAVYLAARAYFLATGRTVNSSHATTQRTLSVDLLQCKHRFPLPWCSVLTGDPAATPLLLANSPSIASLSLHNPLVSPYKTDPWQHYGLFLKTTRDRQLDKLISNWKKDHQKKKISRAERRAVLGRLRATTFLDGLYRMRIRSNYQDIDSFAFGDATVEAGLELHQALCHIVHTSLLVFETLIAKTADRSWLDELVRELVTTPIGRPVRKTAVARWKTVQQYL
jgi:hypothetical protein